MNACTSGPCNNGGSCTVTGDGSYSCQCTEGFFGESCEKGKGEPCRRAVSESLGNFKLGYEYGIEYEYDFSNRERILKIIS